MVMRKQAVTARMLEALAQQLRRLADRVSPRVNVEQVEHPLPEKIGEESMPEGQKVALTHGHKPLEGPPAHWLQRVASVAPAHWQTHVQQPVPATRQADNAQVVSVGDRRAPVTVQPVPDSEATRQDAEEPTDQPLMPYRVAGVSTVQPQLWPTLPMQEAGESMPPFTAALPTPTRTPPASQADKSEVSIISVPEHSLPGTTVVEQAVSHAQPALVSHDPYCVPVPGSIEPAAIVETVQRPHIANALVQDLPALQPVRQYTRAPMVDYTTPVQSGAPTQEPVLSVAPPPVEARMVAVVSTNWAGFAEKPGSEHTPSYGARRSAESEQANRYSAPYARWPELPESIKVEPEQDERLWRAWTRQQRLDEEQRGSAWNV